MLVIEPRTDRRFISDLPRLVVIGVAVMAIGLGLDLVVHLAPVHDHAHAHAVFDPEEQLAHVVGFVGMVITWLGVVADGVRRQLIGTREAAERSLMPIADRRSAPD